jgi:hypothetical protein
MTAAVVIRGALAAVLGQKLGGTGSAVMPILSEPGVAKLSMSIKGCAREAELKGGDVALHESVLRAVEASANATIAADLPVTVLPFVDKEACAAAFGGKDTATDEAPSGKEAEKAKKALEKALKAAAEGGAPAPVVDTPGADVICIPGCAAVCNATKGGVCASTGVLGSVKFEILSGKEAKKASLVDVGKPLKVIVKFSVATHDAPPTAAAGGVGAGAASDSGGGGGGGGGSKSMDELISGLVALDIVEVRDRNTKADMTSKKEKAAAEEKAQAAVALDKQIREEEEAVKTAAAAAAAAEEEGVGDMVVDPWTVRKKTSRYEGFE